jgi:predicted dithiol-disulfide oxidoreductase (DUF899 family)
MLEDHLMSMPTVVSAEEWQKERDALLAEEKEATRRLDAIAAQRRRLPMVRFDNDKYVFETPDGPKRLLDFFEGHPQLAVYQFMDNGPDAFCPGCTFFTKSIATLAELAKNGVAWRTVSNMPLAQMTSYWERQGWTVPYGSSHGSSFAADCGVDGGFMLNLFFTDGTDVYRTYSTTARGVDRVLFANNILDLAAYGRQEEWEDSPEGWPQFPTYG